ncbi:MAG: hypothetical protein RIC18_04080 [Hoeflea sp.]|uniref:hypothetical protein n=1 Tax=Hoeflea sp. TaxID=1940281 RepID=UPI0032EC50B6
MKPSRLFYAVMMTFWMVFLTMLAMVFTYAPQGGVSVAGLHLFAGAALVEGQVTAMAAIGLSDTARSVVLGLLGGLYFGAAGLTLFSMLFCVFGEEDEQRDARPLSEGAAGCAALAGAVTILVGLAGGRIGELLFLQLLAMAGLVLIVLAVAQTEGAEISEKSDAARDLDDVIANHAAANAAFSARLANLTRREFEP